MIGMVKNLGAVNMQQMTPLNDHSAFSKTGFTPIAIESQCHQVHEDHDYYSLDLFNAHHDNIDFLVTVVTLLKQN